MERQNTKVQIYSQPLCENVLKPACSTTDDLEEIKRRCQNACVKSLIITGTSLRESRSAVELAKAHG